MRRVTITDVARAAGVSVSTISKVMNGRDGIAAETQQRVQQVIDELGYVGNIGAQSLRARRTGVVGVLVSQFEPYSAEILKGVGAAAEGTDLEIMAWAGASHNPHAPTGWEQKLLGRLAGSLIDGAIIVTPSVEATSGTFPVVAVDPQRLDLTRPAVSVNDEGGTRSAVNHLLELGHRRIGYLGGRDDLASAVSREAGLRNAMAAAQLPLDERHVLAGDYTAVGAAGPAAQLLDDPDRPTAIVAANDVSALQVIAAAHARGLRVPEDLSVVGFDDVPEAARQGLTTVAQPLQAIGAMALSMLLDLLAGREMTDPHRQLPTQLILRGTTAVVAS
ncbi:LacI family DNA-binding transcriptional regulator [Tessaracoccus sp. MC1756]|uniref:LacI family DNA-binding transcriptional regulator n=1 Tax=Tessaracoccus sp. MC1756 TaxID=2760311 RepID=UPI0016041118|nr:LacI family DNA-binding transcriptional regulator [Tessaracoccus sp. MC1756]MBB1509807.1 LacI family DNA-binding transcriptional regulator [Tessaracoccus sp. MC1756]